MTKAKIEKIASDLGWSISWYKNTDGSKFVMFSQSSPAGQDFNCEVDYKTLDEIGNKVFGYYQTYDPSYEAYLWLDESGHGKNGAPHEMGDVYKDMCDCKKMVEELYDALVA